MDMELSPKFPVNFAETEGGGYYNWSAAESPVLAEAKVAAGKLVLRPRGFALPHYADCSKVGYVLEGACGVGLTIPENKKQTKAFIGLKKGDVIPVPYASVSWWYNYGDSDVVIVFLGETTNAYVAGEITYFLLTGPLGHLAAFSPEIVARTYQISVEKAEELAGSQKGFLFLKLSEEEAKTIPNPDEDLLNIWTQNIDASSPDVEVNNGGKSTTLKATTQFPLLEHVGLNVSRLVLETKATRAPSYASHPRVFYVAKGTGKVQIVGLQGKLVLNTKVESSQLFVVPKLFMLTISSDEQGMELVSIVTSSRAMIGELASKTSVLNTIPSVVQVSLDLTPEISQYFMQKMETGTVIVPAVNVPPS